MQSRDKSGTVTLSVKHELMSDAQMDAMVAHAFAGITKRVDDDLKRTRAERVAVEAQLAKAKAEAGPCGELMLRILKLSDAAKPVRDGLHEFQGTYEEFEPYMKAVSAAILKAEAMLELSSPDIFAIDLHMKKLVAKDGDYAAFIKLIKKQVEFKVPPVQPLQDELKKIEKAIKSSKPLFLTSRKREKWEEVIGAYNSLKSSIVSLGEQQDELEKRKIKFVALRDNYREHANGIFTMLEELSIHPAPTVYRNSSEVQQQSGCPTFFQPIKTDLPVHQPITAGERGFGLSRLRA